MQTAALPDLKTQLIELINTAVANALPDATHVSVDLERPKQASHGDYACNIALQAAKALRKNPREVAAELLKALPASPIIAKAEIAGAGFINFFLSPAAKQHVLKEIFAAGKNYGRVNVGQGEKVLLEFVSSNPTGPLHVAHGRAAAFGASLANVLDAAGYQVHREYYVNDAGRQMDILTVSTWLRYLALFNVPFTYPGKCYQGDYVQTMAEEIKAAHGDRFVNNEGPFAGAPNLEEDPEGYLDVLIANTKKILGDKYSQIHGHALNVQVDDMRQDLLEFGVHYDCWFSEQSLYDNGLLQHALAELGTRGYTYRKDGALWFKSSEFGDEKDRVLQRENGLYTYFAPDIAYHLNKFERGFDRLIDLWGPDHHGYIPRVRASVEALGRDPSRFLVIISQLVKLYRDGELVKLSTRAGNYVTLRDLRSEVGNDAARFFYVLRKSDQHLDFDLDLAKSKTNDNPVYYIQYAHARICRVHEQWGGNADQLTTVDISPLTNSYEMELMQALIDYPQVIASAARDYAPHTIAYYLKDLAAHLHSYYNAEQFLVEDEQLKLARLALITATRQVISNGLALLGVSSPEKM
ncbi:MAG: arginine--tRNA ligase [Pseudomonadota bacterium]